MKTIKIIGFLLLLVTSFSAQKNVSIDLEGTILCENRTLKGAVVSVTQDGKPFTSFVTDIDGAYNLYLPLGSEYVVTVSKKEYVKKIYTVSTTGVPYESSMKNFPVLAADLDLLHYYEGLDYSLFEQPMNKYYYNPKKDNFEYDKDYLKTMLALVEEFKKNEKKNLRLAALKAEENKRNELAAKQKEERTAYEAEALKKMEDEQKALSSAKVTVEKPLVADAVKVQKKYSEYVYALLLKYKPGVTEEIIEGKGVIIIKRVVVKDEMAWVYQKKIFSWGGIACFRDGAPITESIFEQETKTLI